MRVKAARGVLPDYLVTLAPWLGYIALTEVTDSWRLGFLVGLAVSAGVVTWRTLRKDSRFMDVGTLCYCATMSAVSLAFPSSPLRPFAVSLSLVTVGALSLFSLVFPPPFTYRIHRSKVAAWIIADKSLHAIMMHAHRVATGSWAVAQALAGIVCAALVPANVTPAILAAQVVGVSVPVCVTHTQHRRFLRSVASHKEMAPNRGDAMTAEDTKDALTAEEPAGTETSPRPAPGPVPADHVYASAESVV
jgi:hypothetical protein